METLNALTGIGPALVSGFLACFAVCVLLVITQRWHGLWSLDADAGVQKLHINPTPRVGGIAIATGLLVSWLALPEGPIGDEVRLLSSQLLWAAVPAFVAGLLEDLTKKIGVRSRLLATCASGLLAALLTGYAVSRVHVPGFDWLLAFAPVAFLFTAFAVGGVANSINIIDGLNGLASGVVVLMLLALGVLSYQVGDETLLIMSAMAGVVVLGFMLVNYPQGWIFLGDAGAYTLGFWVAMLAVALVVRHPADISPWAMLLVVGYPVIETLFSIYRRITRKRRQPAGSPDASHLHSLVYGRVVSRHVLPDAPAWVRNACATPFVLAYAFLPMLGAMFWPESLAMVLVWLWISFMAYRRYYRRLLRLGASWPVWRKSWSAS